MYIVKLKVTGELFAMKTFKKETLVEKKELRQRVEEKNVLVELQHEFMTNIHRCFHDEKKCYIVMDLCTGGDLDYLL